MDNGTRLDIALVQRGYFPSRQRAQAAIAAGLVWVGGRPAEKGSLLVAPDAAIVVLGDPVGYVSRGALKLAAAVDHFQIPVDGRVCLDIGASTGGFTELLLRRGAARVYAVDVGSGQLHPTLRADPRVVVLEDTDVRRLAVLPSDPTAAPPSLATVDVSFISLTQVLPHVRRLAPAAELVALIKPQFDAGRAAVGKGGIVRDPRDQRRAVEQVLAAAAALGWRCAGTLPSPILGGDGNCEYLGFWVLAEHVPGSHNPFPG